MRRLSKRKNGIEQPQGLKQGNQPSAYVPNNLVFEIPGMKKYKFDPEGDEMDAIDPEREGVQSSPLRTSHLMKSNYDDSSARESSYRDSSARDSLTRDSITEKPKNPASKRSLKDKENISGTENEIIGMDINVKRKPIQNSAARSKSKQNQSPPKHEKMDKTSSLECRLAGANKAIKSLEGELKSKNDKINELTREIEKKHKLLESHQSSNLAESFSHKSNQVKESMTTMMRKKEKEMEKKMKEQEIMLTENKKYMTRLQELNAKLLSKVKDLEDENLFLKKNQETSTKLKAYEDDNKK